MTTATSGGSLIQARDLYRCVRCGSADSPNVHHRKRRSQGGPDTGSNCLTLCGSGTTGCHGWVHAHPEEAMFHGWLVSGDAEPGSVPVYSLLWKSWVLLSDDLSVKLVEHAGDARTWRGEHDDRSDN